MKHGASIHAAPMAIDRPPARAVELGTPIALALAAAVLVALLACGGTGAGVAAGGTPDAGTTTPDAGTTTPDAGTVPADGTKGTGSGGSGIPQPSTDAAAWFITDGTTTSTGQAIDLVGPGLDFDAIPGAVQGGTAVGSSRPDGVLVYNVSRKADLTITAVAIAGANPSDFSLDQANVDNALATTIPPNKSAFVRIGVTFTPQAVGPRSGSLELTSNAGTASVSLTGTGLSAQPVFQAGPASLSFFPASAPAPVHVTNAGGGTVHLTSSVFSGADPGAFQIVVSPQGSFRCFDGIALGPLQSCDLEVGPVAGQVGPKSALLVLSSDDPTHATVSIQLTLQ